MAREPSLAMELALASSPRAPQLRRIATPSAVLGRRRCHGRRFSAFGLASGAFGAGAFGAGAGARQVRAAWRQVSRRAGQLSPEETSLAVPGSGWNRFRLSQAESAEPAVKDYEVFQRAMDEEAPLVEVQAAVASLCAMYPPGCVMALCAAVRHRWLHLPKKERRGLLLTLRQLSYLNAAVPVLVAGALSVGSIPALGDAAGIERKQVEAAFGDAVATLLVELQQFAAIERTVADGGISPGKIDLALSLLTAQQAQSRSTESLIAFLANKAAELRLLSLQGPVPESESAAALGTDVFAALANLLGLGRIKDELEDAGFAITHPEERTELRRLLGGPEGEALVNSASRELQQVLETGQPLRELSSLRVSGRAKTAYSTWKKMKKKRLEFQQVWDRSAIRVILDAPSAERAEQLCYEVRDIIAQMWPLRDKQKDYIGNPKSNGYRSLHLVAQRAGQPFEVQIRTEEMHRQAEYGSCGHWEYKAGKVGITDAAAGAGKLLFADLDLDGDGRIDRLELQHALQRVGVEATLEQVDDMLEVFDSDGDGAVDFKEFWKALVTTWFPLVSGTHRPRLRSPGLSRSTGKRKSSGASAS